MTSCQHGNTSCSAIVSILSVSAATRLIKFSFCGVFGSSGPALGVATIADVGILSARCASDTDFRQIGAPEGRGRALSIYAIGPMVRLFVHLPPDTDDLRPGLFLEVSLGILSFYPESGAGSSGPSPSYPSSTSCYLSS